MNVYESIRRYAENKPAYMPIIAIKIGMYAIAFKYHLEGGVDDKQKVSKYIDILLEEFFVKES